MKTALFIIQSSPRMGMRAVEALRIAAGISAWKKIEPSLYLRDEAVLLLSAREDFHAEDEIAEWLRILTAVGKPFHISQDSPHLPELRENYPVKKITDVQLATLAAASDFLLRF